MSKDRVITKEVALILFKLTLFYQRICELFKKEKKNMDEGNETK